jgi:hypothetical protein
VFSRLSLGNDAEQRSLQQFVKRVGRDPRYLAPIPVDRILTKLKVA